MISKLKEGIIMRDEERSMKIAKGLCKLGVNPLEVIHNAIVPAAKVVGDKFESGEFYLPELLIAAEIMKSVVDILTSDLSAEKMTEYKATKLGKVVIATVYGDIHDIGKNLLATLLRVNGFEVYDLGKDVESMKIVEKALEVNADIIALSSLMTTSMPAQKEVIDILKELKVRDKYVIMVGGGSVTKEWADEIGADGWAETAVEAVELAKELIQKKRSGA